MLQASSPRHVELCARRLAFLLCSRPGGDCGSHTADLRMMLPALSVVIVALQPTVWRHSQFHRCRSSPAAVHCLLCVYTNFCETSSFFPFWEYTTCAMLLSLLSVGFVLLFGIYIYTPCYAIRCCNTRNSVLQHSVL